MRYPHQFCLVWLLPNLGVALSASSPSTTKKQAVVVGAGPVGLATAITLSKPPHNYNVCVLEKAKPAVYEPGRSYVYNINPRGMKWVDTHPPALEKMLEKGATPPPGGLTITSIPADPNEPIQQPDAVSVGAKVVRPKNVRNFWIPRHATVELLQDCCKIIPTINVLEYKEVVDLQTSNDDDETITVQCSDGSSFEATLVVAADGIDSVVRQILSDPDRNQKNQQHFSWLHRHDPKQFRVRQYTSPATGLKMKCLQFPADFKLPQSDGSWIETHPELIYVYRTVNKGTRSKLSLGLLPVKSTTLPRPANVNTRHDHQIWSLKTGPQAKEWFQKAFPRITFEDLVDDAEWERFAAAKGTTYPACQYSPGSAVVSPTGQAGVVMVGDACHAFPPDIGQGINAGLQDVLALDRALQGKDITTGEDLQEDDDDDSDSKPSLGDALLAYQRNRGPEHRALIRIARFGSPYQYRQTWRRDQIGRALWLANVTGRLLLHKLTFGLIPQAAIIQLVQKPELTYRQVAKRADLPVLGVRVVLLGLLVRLVLKRISVPGT